MIVSRIVVMALVAGLVGGIIGLTSVALSLPLWVMAIVCFAAGWYVSDFMFNWVSGQTDMIFGCIWRLGRNQSE